MTREEHARDVLLRIAANFPGLVTDEDVDGAELVEWLANEFHYMIEVTLDTELIDRAANGTPEEH